LSWLTVHAAALAAPCVPLGPKCALAKTRKWLPWVTLSKHPPSGDQYAQFTELPSWNVDTGSKDGGLKSSEDAEAEADFRDWVAAQDCAEAPPGSFRKSNIRTVRSREAAAK
jgi:hypothetical protein